jgi:hypothetical protein
MVPPLIRATWHFFCGGVAYNFMGENPASGETLLLNYEYWLSLVIEGGAGGVRLY